MSNASAPAVGVGVAGAEGIARRLYSAHRPRLLAIARHNCGNSDDAEEALHDAFVLFIDHFDPTGEAPPLPWLTLTLKRRCWAIYGQRRRHARPAGHAVERYRRRDERDRTPEDLFEATSEAAKFGEVLRRLKPEERRALALFCHGYTYSEICAITDWSYSKVNRLLANGRARLRAQTGG